MSARAWAGFAAVSVLWGIPYLFIKIAVDDGVPPIFLAWVRVTLGAAILLALGRRAGVLGSARGRLGWLALYALIEIALPFPLIAAGEQHVSSSLAAILVAAVPAFVVLLSLRFEPAERLTPMRLAGLVVGFAGVVALVGIDVAGEPDELLGAGAILLATFGYACGPVLLMRKFSDLDPRATMGVSLGIAAVYLLPLALLFPPQATPTGEAIAALAILGVFCTAAAFVLFGVLIVEVGASRASIITYVAPVIAVALGVVVLSEEVGPGSLIGLVLILAGSWMSTRPPGVVTGRTTGRRSPS